MNLKTALAICSLVVAVNGHGRLLDPPSRATMWRYGFKNPKNYDDNQLFCGGAWRQWSKNGGKCGVCGDPYDATVRPHEAGGKYANGIIVRHYPAGQTIDVIVHLTANHLGWFEFRICPTNDKMKVATEDCLNRHLLVLADGTGTRYKIDSNMRMVKLKLKLPDGLTCSQCVFQWKYNTGNSFGIDPATGKECKGCGPQEQFYACADVSIGDSSGQTPNPSAKPGPKTSPPAPPSLIRTRRSTVWSTKKPSTKPTRKPTQRPTRKPTKAPKPLPGGSCRAYGVWARVRGMHAWCNDNCLPGPGRPVYCPTSHCICT